MLLKVGCRMQMSKTNQGQTIAWNKNSFRKEGGKHTIKIKATFVINTQTRKT